MTSRIDKCATACNVSRMASNPHIALRIDRALLAEIDKLAKADGRSRSDTIRRILTDAVALSTTRAAA